jgi:hypothetical protein
MWFEAPESIGKTYIQTLSSLSHEQTPPNLSKMSNEKSSRKPVRDSPWTEEKQGNRHIFKLSFEEEGW